MTYPISARQGRGILRCRDIELAFGGLRALKGVSLEIAKGQIFGLVGPNGSGKTSMVNVITGFYRPQLRQRELVWRKRLSASSRTASPRGASPARSKISLCFAA